MRHGFMTLVASKPAIVSQTGVVSKRISSLDAYRGLVMLLMAAEVLDFSRVSKLKPDSAFWRLLAHHQSHVAWVGCSLHDLIQPSFSFLVGVAMPFSLASREAKGQSDTRMMLHASWRSVALIMLGVLLRTIGRPQIYWTFEDTLSQIGMGYFFLFLLGKQSVRAQWIAFVLIVAGYWAAFALYPLPGPDFNYAAIGIPKDWPNNLSGFAAHWNRDTNLAWAFDTWFLNLFPREKLFTHNYGGYVTLSFIPTLATMVLGLIAGGVLRGGRAPREKVKWLVIAGVISLATGWVIGWLGICPVVKRIWTPSWVLFSGGWCFLFLAALYALIDIAGHKRWAFPLVVIGMNSIAAYCLSHLFDLPWLEKLTSHFASGAASGSGSPYETLLQGGIVLLVLWLILFAMYRAKLFLRI
jgi:heparan-alpha-glucosaminide N-acetyltransferase